MRDYAHNLPMALLRAREAVMARFRPILRAHGLTEQQWRIIRVLAEHDGLDATALSQLTLISLPSLTRILRSMERSGVVLREAVSDDSRRKRVRLRAKGHAIFRAISPLSEATYRSLEDEVGKAELEQIYRLLDSLAIAGTG